MTVPPVRTAAFAFALSLGVLSCTATQAEPAAEQDTTHGVAPTKPSPASPAVMPEHTATGPGPAPAAPLAPAKPASPAAPASEAQRYCDNIATVAAEARFAWQTKKLTELQGQVAQRIAELEKKQGELEASLARRDDAMKRAQATLIGIYAKMAPDAAAAQLSLLEDETAAAVLAQLAPRQSSAILNEIRPERASQLVGVMSGLPATPDKPDGKKS